jgi:hypothetical protein
LQKYVCGVFEGPPKQNKKQQARKTKPGEKRPANFSFFFFFFLGAPFKRYARRLWTFHRRWAPAAG